MTRFDSLGRAAREEITGQERKGKPETQRTGGTRRRNANDNGSKCKANCKECRDAVPEPNDARAKGSC